MMAVEDKLAVVHSPAVDDRIAAYMLAAVVHIRNRALAPTGVHSPAVVVVRNPAEAVVYNSAEAVVYSPAEADMPICRDL